MNYASKLTQQSHNVQKGQPQARAVSTILQIYFLMVIGFHPQVFYIYICVWCVCVCVCVCVCAVSYTHLTLPTIVGV